MPAQVKIRLGNLFDGPSDLIVLPCSTSGSITDFVAHTLASYKLPHPPSNLRLGTVDIQSFPGGQNIAQFIAFAASVGNMSSTKVAIESIGAALGKFTIAEERVRAVSAPLLGAGAGGIRSEIVVEALKLGFQGAASPNATLTISVLHRSVYDRFSKRPQMDGERSRPIRVFISYTATDQPHSKWVEAMATHLRNNGVEARLDRWHLKKGMDLPQWMTNELQLADRVVIISDEQYAAKADGRVGGVGWETMIIQGDAAMQGMDSSKYLLIVRSEDFAAGTPKYLKSKFAFHWHHKSEEPAMREDLLKELFQVPSEPPLGSPPVFLS